MIGQTISHYRIIGQLGRGGMGVIYEAEDTRLGRHVALKFLPEGLFASHQARERFRREARAASALDHPNICSVYEIDEHEGQPFISMQLLKGQTLEQRLAPGPLKLDELLGLGIQLADALDAAHEAGIVHRDIKPLNIFVTDRGQAKVLDFGLAKLETAGVEDVDSARPTEEQLTGSGMTLGTIAYMSPEQARGEELDARTDLFSLGVVLYEMATGRHPFAGSTSAARFDAILNKTPTPPVRLNPEVPEELERVIGTCLEKDRDLRCQTASELRADLKRLARDSASGTTAARPVARSPRRRRAGLLWTTVGVVTVVAILGWWLGVNRAQRVPNEPIRVQPFTSDGGLKSNPRLSPDGESVAYEWSGPDGDNWDIYVKAMGVNATPLRLTTHPARDLAPAWSPDQRQIAFLRWDGDAAALYTVPSRGGQERKLIDVEGQVEFPQQAGVILGLSWSPDGEWLLYSAKGASDEPAPIVRLSLQTLERQTLTSPPDDAFGDFHPRLSPDGGAVAFFRLTGLAAGQWDLWVQPKNGGEARRLTFEDYGQCDSLSWTPDGREIVYDCRGPMGSISRVGRRGGPPRPVAGVGQGAHQPSIRDGRMIYMQAAREPPSIWRIPGRKSSPAARVPEEFIASSQADRSPDYSPDGRRIAFSSRRSGTDAIWVCEADGSNPVQLTTLDGAPGTPRWSPDGRRIVFESIREGGDSNLFVTNAEGGVPLQLTHEPSSDSLGTWSRDGRWIYFCSNRSGSFQLWKMPAEGGAAVQVTRDGGVYSEESWDSRHVFYTKYTRRLDSGIWRVPLEGGEEVEVLPGPIAWVWVRDWVLSRSGIYFATQQQRGRGLRYAIRFLDLETGKAEELFTREGGFSRRDLAVSPDEAWILFTQRSAPTSELMLVENFR